MKFSARNPNPPTRSHTILSLAKIKWKSAKERRAWPTSAGRELIANINCAVVLFCGFCCSCLGIGMCGCMAGNRSDVACRPENGRKNATLFNPFDAAIVREKRRCSLCVIYYIIFLWIIKRFNFGTFLWGGDANVPSLPFLSWYWYTKSNYPVHFIFLTFITFYTSENFISQMRNENLSKKRHRHCRLELNLISNRIRQLRVSTHI